MANSFFAAHLRCATPKLAVGNESPSELPRVGTSRIADDQKMESVWAWLHPLELPFERFDYVLQEQRMGRRMYRQATGDAIALFEEREFGWRWTIDAD